MNTRENDCRNITVSSFVSFWRRTRKPRGWADPPSGRPLPSAPPLKDGGRLEGVGGASIHRLAVIRQEAWRGVEWGSLGSSGEPGRAGFLFCRCVPEAPTRTTAGASPQSLPSESPLGVSPRPKTSLHFVEDNVTGKRPHSRFETGNLVSKKTSMVSMVGVAQIGELNYGHRGLSQKFWYPVFLRFHPHESLVHVESIWR